MIVNLCFDLCFELWSVNLSINAETMLEKGCVFVCAWQTENWFFNLISVPACVFFVFVSFSPSMASRLRCSLRLLRSTSYSHNRMSSPWRLSFCLPWWRRHVKQTERERERETNRQFKYLSLTPPPPPPVAAQSLRCLWKTFWTTGPSLVTSVTELKNWSNWRRASGPKRLSRTTEALCCHGGGGGGGRNF